MEKPQSWVFYSLCAVLAAVVLAAAGRLPVQPAQAQQQSQAIWLSSPDLTDFPLVRLFAGVYPPDGSSPAALAPAAFTLLENNLPVAATQIERLDPGAQLVIAVNPGPPFAIRDSQGIARYDLLLDSLRAWASALPADQDDLSLLASGGVRSVHLADPQAWLVALGRYQPELRTATPSFDLLSQALDVAADTPARAGMGGAILFITPPPDRAAAAALQSLAAQASQRNIRIYMWVVVSRALFDSPTVTQMVDLAAQTGGQAFLFSGDETIPDLEAWFAPLRSAFQITYRSQALTSGTHSLALQVETSAGLLTSPTRTFDLTILPPNPLLVSPPLTITLQPAAQVTSPGASAGTLAPRSTPAADAATALPRLEPSVYELEILVEFPDGRARPLAQTSLYVDGELAAVNTAAPFERFAWDLTGYTSSGARLVRVEAEDSLGLTGSSIETPIYLEVFIPPPGPLDIIARYQSQLILIGGILAGALLLWGLVLAGRLRPEGSSALRSARPRPAAANGNGANGSPPGSIPGSALPGLAAPQVADSPPPARRLWTEALNWQLRKPPAQVVFSLQRLGDDGQPTRLQPQPVSAIPVILGSDSRQASFIIDEPGIAPQHARIELDGRGQFTLLDLGSPAGTWHNYQPVKNQASSLHNGDLLHLGRIGFRFTLPARASLRQVKISFEDPSG